MALGILKDQSRVTNYYVKACEELKIEHILIDIMSYNWLNQIKNSNCVGFLVAPYSPTAVQGTMYKERLYFISRLLGYPIYPTYEEIFVYENKRNMAYWLQANNIPMPKTWIFYNKNEALSFAKNNDKYPLIFKPNVGSGAIGIKFIRNKNEIMRLVNRIFTKWRFFNRGYTKWYKTKYKIPYPIMDDKQYNNILFQEKIDVKHEWRGVKIGDSYFAHKKLADGKGLHSGSGLACYKTPPIKVMDFIKYVCDTGKFRSMNVDFFEDINGNFYVNELQTIFGSRVKPYQMKVDGKPGRYIYNNGNWVFEEGMFNQNNSYNLRVKDFLKLIEKNVESNQKL